MGKFIIKLLLYLSPLLFVLAIYAYKDPFKVLYHHDHFFSPVDSIYYETDGDYISTQTLIQSYDKYHYDSYIFGSSRSDNYLVAEWAKHIHSNKCYHYDAGWESLYGVEKKFQLLKERHYPIKNALLVFDDELLSNLSNGEGHLRLKHPLLSGQNMFDFQAEFLKDFLDRDFLRAYIDFIFSGHVKKYMIDKGVMSQPIKFKYDESANEELLFLEDKIDKDSMAYYNSVKKVLYTRDTALHYSKPVIGMEQKKLLNNIKAILAENHTSYRVIISPLYDQLKMDSTDLKTLQEIFSKEDVFDFSGINNYTQNKFNYYEASHFRIRVCTAIMNDIYK